MIKVTHLGQDYATVEVNGNEFETSLGLGEALLEESESKIVYRSTEVEKIRNKINEAFSDGNLPYCMDNPYDRARMAEWIFDNNLNK